jgi:hypothetical protein
MNSTVGKESIEGFIL